MVGFTCTERSPKGMEVIFTVRFTINLKKVSIWERCMALCTYKATCEKIKEYLATVVECGLENMWREKNGLINPYQGATVR